MAIHRLRRSQDSPTIEKIDSKRNINTSDELDFEGVKNTVSCGYRRASGRSLRLYTCDTQSTKNICVPSPKAIKTGEILQALKLLYAIQYEE